MEKLKPILIVEHCNSGLMINEQASLSTKKFILSGTFTEFNIKNRNERIYTADKFLPHLNELLARKKQLGVIYGEFDHPDVFDTSLRRVSHTVESAVFNQEKNIIEGSIRLLTTQWGKEARALVEDDCPIFVSSRAAGVTESNGEVTIKKLFTYDAVADPGFASAKMSLNESLGYTNENANFRIFPVDDESKINELFTMNNNDAVTKTQMEEYSSYLTGEMGKIKEELEKTIKEGKESPEKVRELSEYYENLNTSFTKVTGYLDYLAENIQILVNENKTFKTTTENLVKHNDYLAEQLNKSIDYSKYLAEKLDDSINYSQYIAETLSNSIDFSEYIAEHVDKTIQFADYLGENLDKNIEYSEYLAESLDKNIEYSEYLAENVDNSITYSEYLAESLDKNIEYSEYLAENVDNSIRYGEYVAEHLDNSIAYAEYIAENLTDSQAYTNYIAESLDKNIEYQKYITEQIKGGKINENVDTPEQRMGNLKVDNVDSYYDEEEKTEEPVQIEDDITEQPLVAGDGAATAATSDDAGQLSITTDTTVQTQDEPQTQIQTQEEPQIQGQPQTQVQVQDGENVEGMILPGMTVKVDDDKTGEVIATNVQNGIVVVKLDDVEEVQEVQESRVKFIGDKIIKDQEDLLNNIKSLISESKKRKASEEEQPHFLLFLSEARKADWIALSTEDKEKVKVAMNESKYTSEADVLRIIRDALTESKKSFAEVLVEKIPSDLKPVWEKLDAKIQNSIIAQSKLYNLNSDAKFESFWNSRGIERLVSVNEKKIMNENAKFVDNDKLTEDVVNRYISVFKNLK
jgi:hypothetical protein